jgi:hypothetical protein
MRAEKRADDIYGIVAEVTELPYEHKWKGVIHAEFRSGYPDGA